MRLSGHGISTELPPGWEGTISRRDRVAAASTEPGSDGVTPTGHPDEVAYPVAHLASVPMPSERGDFGSGVVEELGPDDVFLGLLEYGPECVGTPAFATPGLPRSLPARRFSRRGLQRQIQGQVGAQEFFTHNGRAFCLYVVLGRDHDLQPLLDLVAATLRATTIEAR